MRILSDVDDQSQVSEVDSQGVKRFHYSKKDEESDEFLRNFFIKFAMKRTLDSF